jgi:hypothetical protein
MPDQLNTAANKTPHRHSNPYGAKKGLKSKCDHDWSSAYLRGFDIKTETEGEPAGTAALSPLIQEFSCQDFQGVNNLDGTAVLFEPVGKLHHAAGAAGGNRLCAGLDDGGALHLVD